jgi:hypothetical protein
MGEQDWTQSHRGQQGPQTVPTKKIIKALKLRVVYVSELDLPRSK